jgi:uncharacterized protein (DUF1684 family)
VVSDSTNQTGRKRALRSLTMRIAVSLITIIAALTLIQCGKSTSTNDPDYVKKIEEWHSARVQRLKTSDNSWLNLVGLFWLKEGQNKFGSDSSNAIIFPDKAPRFCGTLELKNGSVTVHVIKGINITVDGRSVSEMKLSSDADSNTTRLRYGSLLWFVIKRGNEFGIRLRDFESPLLKSFEEIERYPVDQAWAVEATLEPYHPPKIIQVPTILGTIDSMISPGALRFTIDGTPYRIDPVIEENGDTQLFIIFGDKTNGSETYGGGRFIYIPVPDSTGKTTLDFNRAYNPPCVFTSFATCPLPPPQNKMPIKVRAGEKKWDQGHH